MSSLNLIFESIFISKDVAQYTIWEAYWWKLREVNGRENRHTWEKNACHVMGGEPLRINDIQLPFMAVKTMSLIYHI